MKTATNPTRVPVTCPGCGHVRQWAESNLGKRAKCPECGDIHRLELDEPLYLPEPTLESFDGPALPYIPAPRPKPVPAQPTPEPVANRPRFLGLQTLAACLVLGGLAAGFLAFQGPTDIQLLGLGSIAATLVTGGLVIEAIVRTAKAS